METSPLLKNSRLLAGATAVTVLGVSACGGPAGHENQPDAGIQQTTTVEVFAAASLNNAGAELEATYEKANPGVDISFNFAGSSKLVQQIQEGATPDMLITADAATMNGALENAKELKGASIEVIATNALVLATANGNPADISTLDDLTRQGVITALCAAEVPCGKLAHQELESKNIEPATMTEEANVTDVSAKVATGEADAGFIYTTGAASIKKQDQDITVIELPGLERNAYPLAVTKSGSGNDAAKSFADWLANSDEASAILTDYGFTTA